MHRELKGLLADSTFMAEGGVLGFGCIHVYPHTSEGLCDKIASLLKGADAAVRSVLCKTHRVVRVNAVLKDWSLNPPAAWVGPFNTNDTFCPMPASKLVHDARSIITSITSSIMTIGQKLIHELIPGWELDKID